ncbi:hypothetical protein A3Q56_05752 [Intoshia linei]|uniref:Anaphase-promoting complex subunit 7 n=1 Tax=Intoshia linei TaxID=1819745 RepID=A0A177AX03_9BILA|nr:hypothetical protein A3Q56_05752 [Intoshia linei]
MNIIKSIKNLYEAGLYNDMKTYIEILQSMSHENIPRTDLIKIHILGGKGSFKLKHYSIALQHFMLAKMTNKKMLFKLDKDAKDEALKIDAYIIFKISECYVKLFDFYKGIIALKKIDRKYETSNTLNLLALLYSVSENTEKSISTYKRLLAKCPMSLDVIRKLAVFNVPTQDIKSIVKENMVNMNFDYSWFSNLIEMEILSATGQYKESNENLTILFNSEIKQCNFLYKSMFRNYYYEGDFSKAYVCYKQSLRVSPTHLYCYLMAHIYYNLGKTDKMDEIVSKIASENNGSSETLLCAGYMCLMQRKFIEAIYFADRVLLSLRCLEDAYVVKYIALSKLGKPHRALACGKKGLYVNSRRFELMNEMIWIYQKENMTVRLNSQLFEFIKLLPNSWRLQTLAAKVIALKLQVKTKIKNKDKEECRLYFEKALELKPNYSPAIIGLVEFLKNYDSLEEYNERLESFKLMKDYKVQLAIAQMFYEIEDVSNALLWAQRCIILNPSCSKAQNIVDLLNTNFSILKREKNIAFTTTCEEIEDPDV